MEQTTIITIKTYSNIIQSALQQQEGISIMQQPFNNNVQYHPEISQSELKGKTQMKDSLSMPAPENTLVTSGRTDQENNERVDGQQEKIIDEVKEEQQVKRVKVNEDFLLDFPDIGEQMENLKLKRNTFIFGILVILSQIAICVVYGTKFQVVQLDKIWQTTNQPTFQPIAMVILTLLMALLGFTLLFAYIKRTIWSALVFNFFIVAFTIQLYFIANNLINRIGIVSSLQKYSSYWHIYIWNYDYHYMSGLTDGYYEAFGNTMLHAVKAAICNIVIFSAVIGRVGLLVAFFVAVGGTIGFQFCRQILENLGIDFGDGCSMWIYGGFCGSIVSFLLFLRSRKNAYFSTKKCLSYTGSLYSAGFSIFGSTILVILFPILGIHATRSQDTLFTGVLETVPYTVYHSIAASIMVSIGTTFIINGKPLVRDLVNGAVAGGIAIFSPSYYIVVPAYAQIVGLTAGAVQVLVQNYIEVRWVARRDILNSVSFCLFGVQGLIGAAYGSIFRVALLTNQKDFSSEYAALIAQNTVSKSTQPIILGLIAAGLGLGFGLAISIPVLLFHFHRKCDNFQDKSYFRDDEQQPFKEQQSQIMELMENQYKFVPILLPIQ